MIPVIRQMICDPGQSAYNVFIRRNQWGLCICVGI